MDPTMFCAHEDDEWCDYCVPLDSIGILAALDAEAEEALGDPSVWEPDALPSRAPCRNRRHAHDLAHGPACFPLVEGPWPDRVVDGLVLAAVTAIIVAGYAAEWARTDGRLLLEVGRRHVTSWRRR